MNVSGKVTKMGRNMGIPKNDECVRLLNIQSTTAALNVKTENEVADSVTGND